MFVKYFFYQPGSFSSSFPGAFVFDYPVMFLPSTVRNSHWSQMRDMQKRPEPNLYLGAKPPQTIQEQGQ